MLWYFVKMTHKQSWNVSNIGTDNNLQRLNTTTLMEREFNSSTAKQDVLLLRDQLKGNISANLPTINDAMISSSVNTDIVGCFPQRGPGAGPECDISVRHIVHYASNKNLTAKVQLRCRRSQRTRASAICAIHTWARMRTSC